MKRTCLGLVILAACGGDDGPSTVIDAAPAPDAEVEPPCVNMTDAQCGYEPEPVTPDDYSLAEQLALAERFVPAAVYTGEDIWAVSVDYLLAEGGPLQVAEHDGRLNFSYDVDEATTANVFPDPQPDLLQEDLSGLPVTAGSGRGLVYFQDLQGTNTGNAHDEETWTAAWQAIQGSDEPTAAAYPPTAYAHPFWLSKADRLLAIQYFYYYPYDKFTNNHEGDWEHVNIVVRTRDGGDPTLVMAQFSFHGRQLGVTADALYTTGDDHVVIFVGGDGCLNYIPDCYCGDTSGASFPYPGTWEIGYEEELAGTTARPGRAVAAEDFELVLLPRVEDVDLTANPNLSWFGLPMIFGEPTVEVNGVAVISTNNHRSPVGPGPGHDEFDVGIEETDLTLEQSGPQPFDPPDGWTLTSEPPSSTFSTIVNNNCAPN